MVNALIKIDENTNRVLNVVKAKFGLKDKGEAINLVVKKFIDFEDVPDLRPEFVKKIRKIEKQKTIKVENFSKRYNIK
ncbi:MAG TPA: DUF2683 domain-containing protein [Candidatus Pacearchaeota archaeon]|nr:DUF2683 domain-containing protein [Candidatus Pacearchaeota archaeon]